MAVEIRKIDYVNRVVITADERRLPIMDLFDRAGLSTTDSSVAVLGLAGSDGGWISFRLAPFNPRHLQ